MRLRKVILRAVVVVGLAAGAVGLVGAQAQAMPRDACKDARNQATAYQNMARFHLQLSAMYFGWGNIGQANIETGTANGYLGAAEMVIGANC